MSEVDRISMFHHGRADGRALANLKWLLPGSSKVWTLDLAHTCAHKTGRQSSGNFRGGLSGMGSEIVDKVFKRMPTRVNDHFKIYNQAPWKDPLKALFGRLGSILDLPGASWRSFWYQKGVSGRSGSKVRNHVRKERPHMSLNGMFWEPFGYNFGINFGVSFRSDSWHRFGSDLGRWLVPVWVRV